MDPKQAAEKVQSRMPETDRSAQSSVPSEGGSEVESLKAQVQDMKQKYAYLYADLENIKKRAHLERFQALKFGPEALTKDLLDVIDNLERSLKHISPETNPGLADGLNLTLSQFKSVLEKHGVRIVPSEGEEFDPNVHEAIAQISTDQPKGRVLKEERRGYLLHDRLLRPAQVIVSGEPEGKKEGE